MKFSKVIILVAGISLFTIGFILIGLTIWDSNTPAVSKAKEFEWNRTWGGNLDDEGYRVAVDSLDNIYIVGSTKSLGVGGWDILLVKYNENGVKQWCSTWGGNRSDRGYGVAIDSLNNVYVVGSTLSFGAENNDVVLIKYDKDGEQQWNRTWGGGYNDYGKDVAVDLLGNVFIVGDKYKFGEQVDMLLVKYDKNGMQLWNRSWDGGYNDFGNGMAIDSSGNAFIVGDKWTNYDDYLDCSLVFVKYAQNGIQQWNCTWGGKKNDNYGNGMILDASGNVYLVGATPGPMAICALLVKYNGSGIQQWNRIWGEVFTYNDGNDVAVDLFGNVYLVGFTESSLEPGNRDAILLIYDRNGTLQNNFTWGGDEHDIGYGVAVDSLGNVYIGGCTNSFGAGRSDMFLMKYNNVKQSSNDVVMILMTVPIESSVGVITIFTNNNIVIFMNKIKLRWRLKGWKK